MALSANRQIRTWPGYDFKANYVVTNGVTVWQGGIYTILLSTGFIKVPAATGEATEMIAGLALEKCIGDGVKTCMFLVGGIIWHAIGSGTVADVGKPVYISGANDDTITLTASTNVHVGTTIAYDAADALFAIQLRMPGQVTD